MKKQVRFLLYASILFVLGTLSACGPVLQKGQGLLATPTGVSTAASTSSLPLTQTPLSVNVNQAALGAQIVSQTPPAGQRLDLQPVISLTFDRDMNRQTTAAAWAFLDAQGKPVAGASIWMNARTFQFTPSTKLDADAVYWGTFAASASDASGKALPAGIRVKFQALSALSIGEVLPADGTGDVDTGTNITVVFNKPVVPVTLVEDQASLPQPLEFTPALAGKGEWVNSSMYIFQPQHALDSGASYTARISAGLKLFWNAPAL